MELTQINKNKLCPNCKKYGLKNIDTMSNLCLVGMSESEIEDFFKHNPRWVIECRYCGAQFKKP